MSLSSDFTELNRNDLDIYSPRSGKRHRNIVSIFKEMRKIRFYWKSHCEHNPILLSEGTSPKNLLLMDFNMEEINHKRHRSVFYFVIYRCFQSLTKGRGLARSEKLCHSVSKSSSLRIKYFAFAEKAFPDVYIATSGADPH